MITPCANQAPELLFEIFDEYVYWRLYDCIPWPHDYEYKDYGKDGENKEWPDGGLHMKQFIYSMLGRGEISVGSFCIAFMVFIYAGLMIAAFILKRTLPVSGLEFASIIAAIYGIKQGASVAQSYYNAKGKAPNAEVYD